MTRDGIFTTNGQLMYLLIKIDFQQNEKDNLDLDSTRKGKF